MANATLTIVAILTALLSISPCQSRSSTTWVISQTSRELGDILLYVHDDAIKAVKKQNGYVILCTAPKWTVTIFDPNKKLICDRSFSDFQKRGLFSSLAPFYPRVTDQPHFICSPCTFKGVKVMRGGVPTSDANKQKSKEEPYSKLFIVTREFAADRHVFNFLRRLYTASSPDLGLLLEWEHRGSNEELMLSKGTVTQTWIKELTTKEIKQIPYKASDFERPSNYKTVPDSKILFSDTGSMIDDFLPRE